jgi:DegV family protein with EDD domain
MAVRIVIDSTADVRQDLQDRFLWARLTIHFGDEEYIDGQTIDKKTFYEKLVKSDVLPTTSQATPAAFEELFSQVVKQDDTAVVLTISSELSGTFQSACIAAADYEGRVFVVDSHSTTIGTGILAQLALEMADAGMDAGTIAQKMEKSRENIKVVAMLDTLEYLKKGGRISKTAAFAGNLLSIKPVIMVTDEGKLVPQEKVQGRMKSMRALVDRMAADCVTDPDSPVYIVHSDCMDDVEKLKKLVENKTGLKVHMVNSLGPVVGAHTGPGTVAVFYVAKNNR